MSSLEESRNDILPSNINHPIIEMKIIESWTPTNILQSSLNYHQQFNSSTMSIHLLSLAIQYIHEYLIQNLVGQLQTIKILEIMCGNSYASKLIYNSFVTKNISFDYILSDIIDYPNRVLINTPFYQLNTVDAITQYGDNANILLLNCPPPMYTTEIDTINNWDRKKDYGYSDYYAIRNFIELSKNQSHRYIIFIGELGASDGSPGLYLYLLTHTHLQLITRKMLSKFIDMFGGPAEKELFIFQIT
jgi:hypothetical protein